MKFALCVTFPAIGQRALSTQNYWSFDLLVQKNLRSTGELAACVWMVAMALAAWLGPAGTPQSPATLLAEIPAVRQFVDTRPPFLTDSGQLENTVSATQQTSRLSAEAASLQHSNTFDDLPIDKDQSVSPFLMNLANAEGRKRDVSFMPDTDILEYPLAFEALGVLAASSLFSENQRYTIILDPGHGGSDPGTTHKGMQEKILTLDIANRVKTQLAAFSAIDIQLTRDHDVGYSRQERLQSVTTQSADLLISLHFNNLPQDDITLVESFYAGPENILESLITADQQPAAIKTTGIHRIPAAARDLSFTLQSQRISEILQKNVYREVRQVNPKALNAGVKKETLYMLTQSYMPATLIELTCLSNPEEASRLQLETYRESIAQAISDGILEFLTTLPPLEPEPGAVI